MAVVGKAQLDILVSLLDQNAQKQLDALGTKADTIESKFKDLKIGINKDQANKAVKNAFNALSSEKDRNKILNQQGLNNPKKVRDYYNSENKKLQKDLDKRMDFNEKFGQMSKAIEDAYKTYNNSGKTAKDKAILKKTAEKLNGELSRSANIKALEDLGLYQKDSGLSPLESLAKGVNKNYAGIFSDKMLKSISGEADQFLSQAGNLEQIMGKGGPVDSMFSGVRDSFKTLKALGKDGQSYNDLLKIRENNSRQARRLIPKMFENMVSSDVLERQAWENMNAQQQNEFKKKNPDFFGKAGFPDSSDKGTQTDSNSIKGLQEQLDGLSKLIKINVDTSEAEAKIKALKNELKSLENVNTTKSGKSSKTKDQTDSQIKEAAKQADSIKKVNAENIKAASSHSAELQAAQQAAAERQKDYTAEIQKAMPWASDAVRQTLNFAKNFSSPVDKTGSEDDSWQLAYENYIRTYTPKFNRVNAWLGSKVENGADPTGAVETANILKQLGNFKIKANIGGEEQVVGLQDRVKELLNNLVTLQNFMKNDAREMNNTGFRAVKNEFLAQYKELEALLRDKGNIRKSTDGSLLKDLIQIDPDDETKARNQLKGVLQNVYGDARKDIEILNYDKAKGIVTARSKDDKYWYKDTLRLDERYDENGNKAYAAHLKSVSSPNNPLVSKSWAKSYQNQMAALQTSFGEVQNMFAGLGTETSVLNNLGNFSIKIKGTEQVQNLRTHVEGLVADLQKLSVAMNGEEMLTNPGAFRANKGEFQRKYNELAKLISDPKNLTNSSKGVLAEQLLHLDGATAKDARNQIVTAMQKQYEGSGRKDFKVERYDASRGRATVRSHDGDYEYREQVSLSNVYDETGRAAQAMHVLSQSESEYLTTGQQFVQSVKHKISTLKDYVAGALLVQGTITTIKKGFQEAVAMDDMLSNINMTMSVSANQLDQIGRQSIAMGQQMGTSAKNVLSAVAIYANANETSESILKKAQPTVMLANAAGIDTATASDQIQAVRV